MQKQKTIAKWLAIILLLTVIVACYIGLRAIFSNRDNAAPPDIAGADENGGDEEKPPVKPDGENPKPVYSVFPRQSETVNGITVRHVGGEDNDVMLDTVYYFGKRLVFFYTASVQHDVRDIGIHIAVFFGDALTATAKVAEASEQYVTASTVAGGVLVVTKTAGETKLRLFDDDLQLIAQNSCPAYSSYKLFVTSAATRLYVTDSSFIQALSISDTLEVKRSSFVYPLDSATVVHALDMGVSNAIFVQSEQGFGVLTFDANTGFSYKSELLNSRFVQLLPTVVGGKQAVAVLTQSDKGITVSYINDSLKIAESYLIDNAKSAVALRQENGNINVITNSKIFTFCSHIELQNSYPLTFDSGVLSALDVTESTSDNIEFEYVDSETDTFIIGKGTSHCLVKIAQNNISSIFNAVCDRLTVTREFTAESELSVFLSSTNANSFGYMSFGKTDVFYLTLPNQN